MRSTAARSSASVMRMKSPSTMTSETVEQAGGLDPAQGRDREEDRRLHLDAQDAAVGPALRAARVGVVERARGDARADAELRAVVLGLVHGGVHELEVGRGGVRLATRVGEHRAVARRRRRSRAIEVAELHVGLQAAAGADAHDPLDAELDQLLDDDRGARAAHAGGLHRDGRALERAGEPEHAALAVDLARAVEERLGDVTRAQRVAREEDGLGVVAGLGAEMDWHDPRLYPHGVSRAPRPCAPARGA